jgi:shikimate dehydrogenase
MPLKVEVIQYLDQLDDGVKTLGAVNTILSDKGSLIGYNTDGKGALMALKANNEGPADKKIVILGAGGASRAISFSLAEEASEVVILNRTLEKAESLIKDLSSKFGNKVRSGKLSRSLLRKELREAELLINATSLGMHPTEDKTPVKKNLLRPDLPVFDLVYDPLETRLLMEARSVGAKTIDGLAMLVYQGAASFELWTGKKAPIHVMLKAAQKKIEATKSGII